MAPKTNRLRAVKSLQGLVFSFSRFQPLSFYNMQESLGQQKVSMIPVSAHVLKVLPLVSQSPFDPPTSTGKDFLICIVMSPACWNLITEHVARTKIHASSSEHLSNRLKAEEVS